MKKVYFHVGSGRCGSTLIQAIFNDKMFHDIFQQHRRRYDPQLYLDTGIIAHDETFVEAHWQPIRDKFFKPMATMDVEGFFFTQENLLGMRSGKDQKNICDVACEKIAYLAEGFEPHIIILIRRQDTYIESLYNQNIKRLETRTFETFLDEFPRENWHWADNIDIYAKYFGRDNVTVIPFEQIVYAKSGRNEFLDTVLMAIGISTRFTFKDLPVVNASLAPRTIEVQRIANLHLEEREALGLADWFATNIQKKPGDSHKLMSDAMRQDILEYYRLSNTRLCEEYLTEYPAALAYFTGTDKA